MIAMRIPPILSLLAVAVPLTAAEVTYEPGCLAKIYVVGRVVGDANEVPPGTDKDNQKLWPITALPDSPAETLKLSALPAVDVVASDPNNGGNPNTLVRSRSGILRDVNYYAVEFEGWFKAEQDGIYTLSVQSDDPVEVYVEGKAILRSTFVADWTRTSYELPLQSGSAQGSMKLAKDRWYHVALIAKQRWAKSLVHSGWRGHQREREWNENVNSNRGASFKAFLNPPTGSTMPLALSLPDRVADQ
jgi:hypothetical protein